MNTTIEITTMDDFASKIWKRVIGNVANEFYIQECISEQFKWLVSLENTPYLPPSQNAVNSSDEWTDTDDLLYKSFSPVVKQDNVVRKRVCTNILEKNKVCMRKECTFAHNIEEWSPELCKYGKKCKTIDKCERLHGPKDTKELLAKKLNFVFMNPKKYVKTKMHIKSATHNKKTK
jgi:hypothetical protein